MLPITELGPSIAAGRVVLLAGLSLVGSIGDVVTGVPVTAAGRFFELVTMTAATIAALLHGVYAILNDQHGSHRYWGTGDW